MAFLFYQIKFSSKKNKETQRLINEKSILEIQLTTLSNELKISKDKIHDIQLLKISADDNNFELQIINNQHETKIEKLEISTQQLKLQISELLKESEKIKFYSSRQNISIGESAKEIIHLRSEIESARAQISNTNNNSTDHSNQEQTIEIEHLTEKCRSLDEQRQSLESTIEFWINKFRSLESEAVTIESRIRGILDLDAELEIIKNGIFDLTNEKDALSVKYNEGKSIYANLQKQISLLEDTLEIYSYGLYEPHFNYDTSTKFKEALDLCHQECKHQINSNLAIKCYLEWRVNGSRIEGKKQTRHYSKIMLRAFNGECDSAILKIRWNNAKSMEERINQSYTAINKLGETHSIRIESCYLDIKLKELRLTHEYQEKLHEEREEQRRIREQMREEERALREMEEVKIEAEKDALKYKNALDNARIDLNNKHGADHDALMLRIEQLEKNLKDANDLKERAISMAQLTKAGHVYVISNIGSFGDNIYKIGMTRRLDPAERVRELGGASVPFGFDIHAMIYSQNAPELESNFHRKFKIKKLNMVNGRKEFFNVTLEEIEEFANELNHKVEFSKIVEARDYRETVALKNSITVNNTIDAVNQQDYSGLPDYLFQ